MSLNDLSYNEPTPAQKKAELHRPHPMERGSGVTGELVADVQEFSKLMQDPKKPLKGDALSGDRLTDKNEKNQSGIECKKSETYLETAERPLTPVSHSLGSFHEGMQPGLSSISNEAKSESDSDLKFNYHQDLIQSQLQDRKLAERTKDGLFGVNLDSAASKSLSYREVEDYAQLPGFASALSNEGSHKMNIVDPRELAESRENLMQERDEGEIELLESILPSQVPRQAEQAYGDQLLNMLNQETDSPAAAELRRQLIRQIENLFRSESGDQIRIELSDSLLPNTAMELKQDQGRWLLNFYTGDQDVKSLLERMQPQLQDHLQQSGIETDIEIKIGSQQGSSQIKDDQLVQHTKLIDEELNT